MISLHPSRQYGTMINVVEREAGMAQFSDSVVKPLYSKIIFGDKGRNYPIRSRYKENSSSACVHTSHIHRDNQNREKER